MTSARMLLVVLAVMATLAALVFTRATAVKALLVLSNGTRNRAAVTAANDVPS